MVLVDDMNGFWGYIGERPDSLGWVVVMVVVSGDGFIVPALLLLLVPSFCLDCTFFYYTTTCL